MSMKLHTTLTSAYGRLARIAAIEHGLSDQLQVIPARTREVDSPYYAINPTGRVPFLVLEDGSTFEDSHLICGYFDSIGDGPQLAWEWRYEDWAYGRLETVARSFLDGIAVLGREDRRPESDQSPTIIAHERARAARCADLFERRLDDPMMNEPLNVAQLLLVCTIDVARFYSGLDLCVGRPNLTAWHAAQHQRPSLPATLPDLAP